LSLRVRTTGALGRLESGERTAILERARADTDPVVEERVRSILGRVRRERDAGLVALTRELDRVSEPRIEVPREACVRALDVLDAGVRRGLERAVANLERVHRAFLPGPVEIESEPGVLVGRRPDPLAAVGVYAPGGRAAYPSSVLMGVVPARVAGVRDVVVASPPGPSGAPSDVVLAAAAIAGATRVVAVGGAQAIAALAFGTESVPKVDRIVGPGNAYVAEAKRQVAGVVGIDAPAGPSEILVIADRGADARRIAHELVAQAEHDPEASCVALVEGEPLREAVLAELARIEPVRREVVEASLSSAGAVLSYDDVAEAYAFAEAYAAEHLLLAVHDPMAALAHVRHAGTVFLGEAASVAFGDYMTGANHVLPTAGAARSYSGLSTLDFVRWTTWQRVTPEAARAMEADVVALAESEGLHAHAAAARSAAQGGGRR
jgi:histidinol dehydrogenase